MSQRLLRLAYRLRLWNDVDGIYAARERREAFRRMARSMAVAGSSIGVTLSASFAGAMKSCAEFERALNRLDAAMKPRSANETRRGASLK